MPLPDERPRASVANLIGRFEQQNKKTAQAGTGPVISGRSSSVISNITGDSAKEVIKEKREWPPKSASSSVDPRAPIEATPFSTNPGPGSPDTKDNQAVLVSEPSHPPPPAEEPLPVPIVADDIQNAQQQFSEMKSFAEDVHIAEKVPKSPKAQPAKETKSPPPSSFRTPSKSQAKTSPRSVSNTSSPPTLRPQHTGQSAASTSSTRKSVPPKAPSTPSRPKTSSGTPSSTLREKTPLSASRSKTPTPSKTPASHAIPARAKTPSSNLFAPTAASLAKARNASAEAPTPIRKVTLSSSAADRLSKPTASSRSKARSPPPVTHTRGSPSSRGAPVSKLAQRGAKPKTASAVKGDKSDAKDNSVTSHEVSAEYNGLHVEAAHNHPDHPNDLIAHSTSPHGIEDDLAHDHGEHAVGTKPVGEELPSDVASPEKREESGNERSATPVKLEASDVGEKQTENRFHDLAPQVDTDIEDMVNLLEQAKARPVSIINIPDNVNEIPDED